MASCIPTEIPIVVGPGFRQCINCPDEVYNVGMNSLCYHFCPYRDKNSFKTGSTLLKYIKQHCPVWTVDPEDCYSTDYIVANLVKIFDDQGLLAGGFLYCDRELYRILEPHSAKIHPRSLRHLVENHLEVERTRGRFENCKYTPVFPDNPHMEQLVGSLSPEARLFVEGADQFVFKIFEPLCPCVKPKILKDCD